MKQFILFFIIFSSIELFARQIEETTFSYWKKPDSKIYYSTPDSINTNTKIIFIMHGASRTAKKYLNDWLPLVKNRNVVLIAPEYLSVLRSIIAPKIIQSILTVITNP